MTKAQPILKFYLSHLPTLLLALIFYSLTFYLTTHIYPEQIQNWLLPDLYLPWQISLFLANFFFLSFLLLNSRRGLLLSLAGQILFFLKLQKIDLTWLIGLTILVFFGIIELYESKRRSTV